MVHQIAIVYLAWGHHLSLLMVSAVGVHPLARFVLETNALVACKGTSFSTETVLIPVREGLLPMEVHVPLVMPLVGYVMPHLA